jgi:signal transduction histidine kinase
MSHELRTPLNAIGGYLQILELGIAGPISEAQRDILTRVDKSSRHLLRLINEVLDLARIEAGYIQYENTHSNVAKVVADIVPMIEPQLASKNIRFDVDVPNELVMMADVERVSQILLNLLGNAAKFTAVGGTVRLWATQSRAPARVHVHVRDTGIGIPADKLDAIFQPFVQVDSSRTRAAEGSGLGLAISRDLARGMGGDLNVSSVVGAGSTFTLSLTSPE